MGVRLDFFYRRRQFIGDPFEHRFFIIGLHEGDLSMGIHDGSLLQIFKNALLSTIVPRFHHHFHASALLLLPYYRLFLYHFWLVLLRVNGEKNLVAHFFLLNLRYDFRGFSAAQLTVKNHGAYPYSLLSTGLSQSVKSGAVEQFSENQGYIFPHDSRAVILHDHLVLIFSHLLYLNKNIGEYARLLACIEGIIDGFLHAHH